MTTQGHLIEIDLALLDGKAPVKTVIPDLPQALALNATNEHIFQESLSRHTEYFPFLVDTHHGNWLDWIIYKYELPSREITDFAYVVTTSVQNTIVLVELEDPAKKMWVGPSHKPSRSKHFVSALEQVERWRIHLQDPVQRQKIIADMSAMMSRSSLLQNPWEIKYALVYGRSSENASLAQKRAYADLQNNSGIHLATYDHLVSAKQRQQIRRHNVVRITAGQTFEYLFLNTEPGSDFAYLPCGSLSITPDIERLLESLDYDIAAWKAGESLNVAGKHPMSKLSTLLARGLNPKLHSK